MSTPNVPPGTQTWPSTTSGATSPTEGSDEGKKEQAKQVAGTAADQAKQTAGTAADEGKHVADVAKGEAQNVAQEAKQQAKGLVDEAMSQVDDQARTQRDRLVTTLRSFADDIEKMANGEQTEGGMAKDLVRQVADRAHELSGRLDGREPQDILDEVRSYARRRPGTFLLGALAAGVVAGRVAKGAKQANQTSSSGTQSYGTGYGTGYGVASSPYDDVRGTATGTPTAGVGYPETSPAYPAGSAVEEPGTTMDQPLGGVGTTGLPGTTPTADDPWTGDNPRGGTV